MKYLILFFCLGFQITALAQSSTVKGVVKGRDGKPLASVSVYIGNYNNGTATNAKGEFTFGNIVAGNYDLIFQCVGYTPLSRTITVKGTNVSLEVTMQERTVELAEVVVTPKKSQGHYPSREWQIRFF